MLRLIFITLLWTSCGSLDEEKENKGPTAPEQIDYTDPFKQIVLKYFETPPSYFNPYFKSNFAIGIPKYIGDYLLTDSNSDLYFVIPPSENPVIFNVWEESIKAASENKKIGDCADCQSRLILMGTETARRILYLAIPELAAQFKPEHHSRLNKFVREQFEKYIKINKSITENDESLKAFEDYITPIEKAFENAKCKDDCQSEN